MRQCNESPPGQLLLAIRQFNARQWYECHETLEDLWIGEAGEVREFLQGTLQIAVALLHWRNGNYGGAVSVLTSGIKHLRHVSDACMWVDVAGLISDANRVREALEELGRERMNELDPSYIPRLRTVSPPAGRDTTSV
jgi:predicted metal-dependent hydrolase